MRQMLPLLALGAIVLACDSSGTPAGLLPAGPAPGPVRTLRIAMDTSELIEGAVRNGLLTAYDKSGAPLATDRAQVVSSNPAVATFASSESLVGRDASTGRTWREQKVRLLLVAPGTATVRVTLDGISDSLHLSVQRMRASNSALVVESFSVIEYRAVCAWACPYLVYAPQLVLREPTGGRTVEVMDVQFTLGVHTTGVCEGKVVFTPGLRAEINPIDAYLWANDMIFVSLSGAPLPGDFGTARVTVRDAGGKLTVVQAIGAVQRMASQPTPPMLAANNVGWSCR